ncbi:aminoacyl-tRNA deacylase [Anaeromyxobacter paludicola]|uniref:YbaK/aminoacyl-tRNA synthetase-associated domain-containing protein n=1 Tax=Anaeromyxobacter paludicola TaxID=2918171 RepID=A0ABN6NB55_9BACT|nr:YbaK/EbsC family protein [Anaeromyxobacter paludicola]BDG10459.1 hypothetical protein AMPC_35720 [Anaeromyxobacter paludicola]
MIPRSIEAHLHEHHAGSEPRFHFRAVTAQRLAAAEHISGRRVAKPVVVRLDGKLALCVVSAAERLDLGALEQATGAPARLATEDEFAELFQPCEAGAEPALGMFGLPIYVDADLARERTLLMRAGTHEDAVELDTAEWMRCEGARPVERLGARLH